MSTRLNDDASPLICVECGRDESALARGWRACLTIDDELAIYCPYCADREFGEPVEADSA